MAFVEDYRRKIIGIDPGLRSTGWGIVSATGNRLQHIGNGTIKSNSKGNFASRLRELFEGVSSIIGEFNPNEAAVEMTFVNLNPASALKLGQARGVVLLAPAVRDLEIGEYSANVVKKSVVGTGHASKEQVETMVRALLAGATINGSDAADALAVAICHAHHRSNSWRGMPKRGSDFRKNKP